MNSDPWKAFDEASQRAIRRMNLSVYLGGALALPAIAVLAILADLAAWRLHGWSLMAVRATETLTFALCLSRFSRRWRTALALRWWVGLLFLLLVPTTYFGYLGARQYWSVTASAGVTAGALVLGAIGFAIAYVGTRDRTRGAV